MMQNLYAELRQHLTDCDIINLEPLTYIKIFLTNKSNINEPVPKKILLLCKKKHFAPKKPNLVIKAEVKEIASDLNVTGSPLRDSCQVDYIDESLDNVSLPKNAWSDEEESYQNISLIRVREILSDIAMMPNSNSSTAFWAVCGENTENILLTSMQLTPEWNKRGILKYLGVISYETINLNNLQAKHFSYIPKHNNQIETTIDSYFQIQNGMKLQLSRSISGPLMPVMLHDYEKHSRIILHQSVPIDNNNSVAEAFWRQIKILDLIKDDIAAYKESGDKRYLIYQVGAQSDLSAIKHEIYQYFTEVAPISYQTDEEDAIADIETIVLKTKLRDCVELTDQLWIVLKRCSSYSDLKLAFEYIFTCAAKYNVVNTPTNDNRLAEWIREVSEKRIAVPHLNGTEPLELLLEIGIEKVSKDYEYIFTESKLCSASDLKVKEKLQTQNVTKYNVRKSLRNPVSQNGNEPMGSIPRKTLLHSRDGTCDETEKIGIQNSHFNLHNVDSKLAHLAQIHLVLEHLLLIRSTLNLEDVYSSFLDDLRKPPKPFSFVVSMKTDAREIDVMNPKILSKIENELPHQLRIVMNSQNKFKFVENTFCYSDEPIFPTNVFPCTYTNDLTSKQYFEHQYLHIGTKTY